VNRAGRHAAESSPAKTATVSVRRAVAALRAASSAKKVARSLPASIAVMEVSQAAISLKLKRLEDRLGGRLLERTPRQVRLSHQGYAFLPSARALLPAHGRAVAAMRRSARAG